MGRRAPPPLLRYCCLASDSASPTSSSEKMMVALRLAVLAAAVGQCATLSGYVSIDNGLSYCNTNAGAAAVYETSASTMADCVALCDGRGSYVAVGYAEVTRECVCYTACDCLEWDGTDGISCTSPPRENSSWVTYFPAEFSQPGYCNPTNNPDICGDSLSSAASTTTVAGFGVAALAVGATASILRL